MVADYLKIIEQKLGIKFTITPTKTWTESLHKVKNKGVELLSATNSVLPTVLTYTESYLSSPIVSRSVHLLLEQEIGKRGSP